MTLLLSSLFGFSKVGDAFSPDPKALLIFALVAAIGITYKKVKKKTISPILLIVVSALLGGVLYSL
ncbi:MAG: chromate transporter, partial [Clostridiales bacterium]|nr:chromate transporter [Candidatus Coliplasma caballi]